MKTRAQSSCIHCGAKLKRGRCSSCTEMIQGSLFAKMLSSTSDSSEVRDPTIRAFLADDEIIVDSFAGGGGASSGLEEGLGESPHIAINHDPEAIAMHKINHPSTIHYCESVWKVNPVEACRGKRVRLAWFSPTCTFFSKARGAPLSAEAIKIRGLAWVAVRWAAKVAPDIICLENVEEFEKWGPLHKEHSHGCSAEIAAANLAECDLSKERAKQLKCKANGCLRDCEMLTPIKEREGETFNAFVTKLRRLGYVVEWWQLRACDFGSPTTRRRLFMVARRDGKAIVRPKPTHGPRENTKQLTPFATAAECIDWTIPVPSIFGRKKDLKPKTLARIARGIRKFVVESPRPFIVPVSYGDKGGDDVRVNDIDEPFPTICGSRGGHAVIVPTIHKAKSYGGGGNDAKAADEPIGTITASKRGEFAVSAATLVRVDHGDVDASGKKRGQGLSGLEDPIPTICAGGGQFGVVDAQLVPAGAFVMPNNTNNVPHSADEPVPTITTGNRNYLAVPYLVHRSNGERPEVVDDDGTVHAGQEPRVYDIAEPLGTIVAGGIKHAFSVALLVKHNGGNNDAHGSSGQDLDRPMDTLATHNTKAVTVAHLAKYHGERREGEDPRGSEIELPLATLDTSNRFGLVASSLVKLRGTSESHLDSSGSSMEDPVPTISSGGMHIAQVAAFLVRYNGESTGQEMASPLGTLDTTDRYGLVTVTIDGEEYVIADIGMRMLTPRELYRAQGFREGYIIDPAIDGKTLSKTAQIRMVGNSVPPAMAKVLSRAQLESTGPHTAPVQPFRTVKPKRPRKAPKMAA